MKYRKKIVSKIITVLLVLSLVMNDGTLIFASEIDNQITEDVISQEDSGEKNTTTDEETLGSTGYIDIDYRASLYEPEKDGLLREAAIPTQYDSRLTGQVSKVKDQGSGNTCWAFSAIGVAESDMMSKGLTSSEPDYSEYQLAYFTYHRKNDPLGNLTGDSTNIVSSGKNYYSLGGTNLWTAFTLASWVGAADETIAPYGQASGGSSLAEQYAYLDKAHLENAYFISMANMEDVKKMIMEHGAVVSALNADVSNSWKLVGTSDYSLYQTSTTTCNHSIMLVGWDDNYAVANFKNTPTKPGAWLVKNSWGNNRDYFWVSYEDMALSNTDAYALDFNVADNYDFNYQYDGSCSTNYFMIPNGYTIANQYQVSGALEENLEAVSVAFADTNIDYSVQIYKNSPTGNPLGGTAMLTEPVTGMTTYEGYYTIPLTQSITFAKGDTFTVAITVDDTKTSGSGTDTVSVFADKSSSTSVVNYVNSVASGQSFMAAYGSAVDFGSKYNANFRIKAFTSIKTPLPSEETKPVQPVVPDVNVTYQTHVQSYGWQGWKTNGEESGTHGESKRLEAIKISLTGNNNLGIAYRTHVQTYGWQGWKTDGEESGTHGQAKRLEAISIKLTGADADLYDIYYRVHAQSYGWLGWAKNGQNAGTAGQAKRLEAIQILVLKKGVKPSSGMLGYSYIELGKAANNASGDGMVNYRTHVQTYGDQSYVYDGSISGTTGESKRLEAISIQLNSNLTGVSGNIYYKTHVQSYGWLGWSANGGWNGSKGYGKRLEAIQIKLTGDVANQYDIYYRVHAQSYGWLGWAKNGESAGTSGLSKRLEGIQIVLVPKGGTAPDYLPGKAGMSAYISR